MTNINDFLHSIALIINYCPVKHGMLTGKCISFLFMFFACLDLREGSKWEWIWVY